ncbi:parathyroid hormone 4 [Erpetoichthys calabaricus]|uniref:Parathyroid hormone 4-like n=1 Tax=Erpetoichthys calabaricus TaxID=27687 RepID=A0A8C4SMU6_ERPCA|nr:parathyroid hormone 4 [Erpetoichthys calabaricus]
MLLSQRSVRALVFVIIVMFSSTKAQDTESKRAVTEHQFMHDKGRAMQSLKRLIWLSSAMGGVHTATGRDLSEMEPAWDHLSGQGRTNFDSPTSKKTQAFKRLLTFLIRDGQRGDTLQTVFNSLLLRDTSRQVPELATSNEK